MSIEARYRSILKALAEYENLLNAVNEDEFIQSPPGGGWSLSETYSHILKSNLGSLMAAEKCILGTGIQSNSIHWLAWIILFSGKFPPLKLKAPESIAAMVTKMSMEDARNLIVKFKSRLSAIKSRIRDADPQQKIKHPRLGLLNAKQWLRFIEIHTIHHTKQLKRISSQLKIINRVHN